MSLVIMLIAVLLVGGAMVATLMVFFRRLRRIEEEFLGKQPHIPWRLRLDALVYRLRHHIRKG